MRWPRDVSFAKGLGACETPHDRLFIFKPGELKSLNIVTADAAPVANPAPATPVTARTRS
jgi:hypothetical protein